MGHNRVKLKKGRNNKMMAYIHRNRFLLAILFAVFLMPFHALAAGAPAIADTPCDPAVFDSHKAEAWKRAQAQITQNQNQIFKPDSVLEYTCFEKFAGVMAKESKNMLSGTDRWGTGDEEALKNDLNATSGDPLAGHLGNFTQKMLGGRDENNEAEDSGSGDVIESESYNCDMMNRVYQTAKCQDFIENPETDGFYTDQQYADDEDKRQLPAECAKDSRWSVNMTTAEHETAPYEKVDADYKSAKAEDCGKPEYPPIYTGRKLANGAKEGGCGGIPNCKFVPGNGNNANGKCEASN